MIQKLRGGAFPERMGKGKVLVLLFFSVLLLEEVEHAGLSLTGSCENQRGLPSISNIR